MSTQLGPDMLERLGCLYLAFLNHPSGMSFRAIRESLPGAYESEEIEHARRKFERDKEELAKLGLDLVCYAPGDTLPNGSAVKEFVYIPNEVHRLPELHLTAEEAGALAAVLFAAMDEAAGEDRGLAETYRTCAAKLLYRHPSARAAELAAPLRLSENKDEVEKKLTLIHDAILRRKVLTIRYPGRDGAETDRDVMGRGLVSHRGRWCLVAFCRRANDIRMFYLDRMKQVNVREEEYKPDPSFALSKYRLHPLTVKTEPAVRIRAQCDPDREEFLRDFLEGGPAVTRSGDIFEFEVTNPEAFFSWIMRNPGVVQRFGPAAVHERFHAHLAAIRRLYAG